MQIFIPHKSSKRIIEFSFALGCLPANQSDKRYVPPAEKIINIFIFVHYNFGLFILFGYKGSGKFQFE